MNEKIQIKVPHFADTFRPMYYFSRFCGQLPFSIVQSEHNENVKPRVSKFDVLWFAISLCLYGVVTWRTCNTPIDAFNTNKTEYVLIIGNSLLHIVTMMFGIVKLMMDMYNRYKLVNVLNKFTQFDQEVRIKI